MNILDKEYQEVMLPARRSGETPLDRPPRVQLAERAGGKSERDVQSRNLQTREMYSTLQ